MPSIETNSVSLEYELRGEGEPILFIMGLSGQLIDWPDEFLAPFLESGFQAILFDNRDVGLSTQASWTPPSQNKLLASLITRRALKGAGYTMPDMADDAAGLLDGLGIDSAHVVGVSMGGMIGQELAVNHPARVRSLCSIMSHTGDRKNGRIALSLIKEWGRRPAPTRENAVEESILAFEAIAGDHVDSEELHTAVKASVERSFTPMGAARQTAAIAGSPDRTARLQSVSAPTLVIHGLKDPLIKPSGGIATARAVPRSRLLMFPDMGHDLPRPRCAEMTAAIVANMRRAA